MPLQGKYDVKLGRSFMDSSPTSFMTMRCDFLPASVDRSKTGTINISNEKEVGVRLPNVNGAEPSSTLFKGNMRPVNKECLLIYNKTTGELTLERISKAAQLKKSRDESAPKRIESDHPPPPPDIVAAANAKLKSRKMSESSSDDEPISKSTVKDNPLTKPRISPTSRRSLPNSATSAKTSTLSSSSSSDSDSGPESNHSPNPPPFSSRSSLSSLSDLSDEPEPQSLKNKKSKPNSVSPEKSLTVKPVTHSPFLIHRDLMENDLHLSESDSDE